jgi:hypothetical protein
MSMESKPIQQNILSVTGKQNLILQQTNCTALHGNGKGLASDITKKWPHVIPYHRKETAKMGSIQLYPSVANSPVICCLNAQFYVGRKQAAEDYNQRHIAFRQSLQEVVKWLSSSDEGKEIQAVYIPEKIGCGLARGDWNIYLSMIDKFANQLKIPCYRCCHSTIM